MKKTLIGVITAILVSWTLTASTPINPELSPEEKAGLQQMREEEKLAHDVYITLNEKWQLPVFKNIAESEKRHMDAIAGLLEDYNLDDSAKNNLGQFTNPEIQKLYDNLVAEGSESLINALKVGASIEDLDIADLDKLLDETKQEDISFVYQNLNNGSHRHLRSFTTLLEEQGVNYSPQYLTQERYEEIVSGDWGNRGKNNGRRSVRGKKGQQCNNLKGGNCRKDKGFNKSCRSEFKNNRRQGRRGQF